MNVTIEKAHQILHTVTLIFKDESEASQFFEKLNSKSITLKLLGAKKDVPKQADGNGGSE